MKHLLVASTLLAACAAPAFAQERSLTDPRGYVTGLGGFSVALGNSTANTLLEGGVRIAPHVMVFGTVGHYSNLVADLQSTIDATTASLTQNQGLDVTGSGSVPATYGLGGVRVEIPAGRHFAPYVLGGFGAARLDPSAQFAYAGGVMPDGTQPAVGTDVTSSLTSASLVTDLPASNEHMMTFGGGVQIPVTTHWAVDAGYRYGRIGSDASLNTGAVNTNGMAFGFGYRF
jgi:opacity protein-like surface antigen